MYDTVACKWKLYNRRVIELLLQIVRNLLGEAIFEALAAEDRSMTAEQGVALENTNG